MDSVAFILLLLVVALTAAAGVAVVSSAAECASLPNCFDVSQHMSSVDNSNTTIATRAIQALLDSVPDHATVWIPASMIVTTGPLVLKSNYLTLQIDGTVRALDIDDASNLAQWPSIAPLINYGFSDDMGRYDQYQSLLYAANITHLHITGTGHVDGRGHSWWQAFHSNTSDRLLAGRPNLVQLVNVSQVEIDGVSLSDAPFWTIHPVLCTHVHIHHIHLRAPLYAPNVDGIDPDSCQHVLIEHNDIACGDDHIAIKAGLCGGKGVLDCAAGAASDMWTSGAWATRNVTVRHNVFRTGMGIAVGSESSGSISDVFIYNNTVGVCAAGHDPATGCGWGPALHLKTSISRGGVIENVSFTNNKVYNTSGFIFLEMSYQSDAEERPPVDYAATMVRNILFDGNEALGSAIGAAFECSAFDACHAITVTNNVIHNANENSSPWTCKYIQEYVVAGNVPDGLEECMELSMNNETTALRAG